MKSKKLSILTLCFTATLALILFVCLFVSSKRVNASEVTLADEINIEQSYEMGETIQVESISLSYKDKQYVAEPFVYLPDGSVLSKATINTNQAGSWKVVYKAKADDGKIISYEHAFTVSGDIFSIGAKSSFENFTHEFIGSKGEAVSRDGLKVTLAPSETFTYNKVVDLNEWSSLEEMLRFYVLPEKIGTADATTITVTFTDVYDQTNKVDVMVHQQLADTKVNSYLQARAPGQTYVGLHRTSNGNGSNKVQHSGRWYTVYRGGIYGALLRLSFPGLCGDGKVVGEEYASIGWDYENRIVLGHTAHSDFDIITDLDETYMVQSWDGFTTGEVKVSVSCGGYNSQKISLFFPKFFEENFIINDFDDTVAPVITGEFSDFEGKIPNGMVGRKYKVFDAQAYDLYDGAIKPTIDVYYGYGTSAQVLMNVEDGYFDTPYVGTYTLIYSAKDRSGNEQIEKIEVVVENENEVKPVVNFVGTATKVYVGDVVSVLDYTVTNATEDGKVVIYAQAPDGTREVVEENFVPNQKGDYTIVYNYVSYAFDFEYTYTLNVDAYDKPVFIERVRLPKYFIAGMTYEIPEMYATNYNTGEKVKAEVYMSKDGGEQTLFTGTEYVVDKASTLKITYKAGQSTVDYNVIVVNTNVNGLDMSKYFYKLQGDYKVSRSSDYINYKAESDEGFTIEFINTLLTGNFSLEFGTTRQTQRVRATLTSVDGSKSIYFDFIDGNCSINGGEPFATEQGFGEETVSMKLADRTGLVEFGQITKYVTTFADGTEFTGFDGMKAVLTIAVIGKGEISISKVNNQNICSIAADIIKPEIYHVSDEKKGFKRIDTTYVLAPAFAADVLNPNVKLTMYVKDSTGKYVTSLDGVVLDTTADPNREYKFTLSSYGKYTVYYDYREVGGEENKDSYFYAITVCDEVPPQILIEEVVNTGTVGQPVKVAVASVTDNVELENEKAYVCVKNPYGIIEYVTKGSFTPTVQGVYTVTFVAYDSSGNITTLSYAVTVTVEAK